MKSNEAIITYLGDNNEKLASARFLNKELIFSLKGEEVTIKGVRWHDYSGERIEEFEFNLHLELFDSLGRRIGEALAVRQEEKNKQFEEYHENNTKGLK